MCDTLILPHVGVTFAGDVMSLAPIDKVLDAMVGKDALPELQHMEMRDYYTSDFAPSEIVAEGKFPVDWDGPSALYLIEHGTLAEVLTSAEPPRAIRSPWCRRSRQQGD